MGARPSSFKRGGGKFNGVEGLITGYEFTTVYPFGEGNTSKKSEFNSLYFVLKAKMDGADVEEVEPLWAGNADNFEISDDGLTITPVEPGFGIGASSDLGKFIASMCEKGFPETDLPEDDEPINYEAIIGWRVSFVQVQQVDKAGKPMTRVVKKGTHKGKTFPVTAVQVSQVIGKEGVAASRGKTTVVAKGAKKATNGSGKVVKGPDVSELALETLTQVLDQADGSIPKRRLQMKVFGLFGAKQIGRAHV